MICEREHLYVTRRNFTFQGIDLLKPPPEESQKLPPFVELIESSSSNVTESSVGKMMALNFNYMRPFSRYFLKVWKKLFPSIVIDWLMKRKFSKYELKVPEDFFLLA